MACNWSQCQGALPRPRCWLLIGLPPPAQVRRQVVNKREGNNPSPGPAASTARHVTRPRPRSMSISSRSLQNCTCVLFSEREAARHDLSRRSPTSGAPLALCCPQLISLNMRASDFLYMLPDVFTTPLPLFLPSPPRTWVGHPCNMRHSAPALLLGTDTRLHLHRMLHSLSLPTPTASLAIPSLCAHACPHSKSIL